MVEDHEAREVFHAMVEHLGGIDVEQLRVGEGAVGAEKIERDGNLGHLVHPVHHLQHEPFPRLGVGLAGK
jgi:hypothetical protein